MQLFLQKNDYFFSLFYNTLFFNALYNTFLMNLFGGDNNLMFYEHRAS